MSVVEARPDFIKIAQSHKALNKYQVEVRHIICQTGQHFDKICSENTLKNPNNGNVPKY